MVVCSKAETSSISRDSSFTSKAAAVDGVSVTPSATAPVTAVSTPTQSHVISTSNTNTATALDLFSPVRDCRCHLSVDCMCMYVCVLPHTVFLFVCVCNMCILPHLEFLFVCVVFHTKCCSYCRSVVSALVADSSRTVKVYG